MKTSTIQRKKQLRAFVGTTLASASLFQLAMPVLAELAAGASISNTATATYTDPTTGRESYAESNPVVVKVAEVAGITVTSTGIEEKDNAATGVANEVNPGDTWYYKYEIKNVGNDTTYFRLPTTVGITGPGVITSDATKFEYLDKDGNWVAYNNPTSTEGLTGLANNGAFSPNGSLIVRVGIQIQSGAQTNNEVIVKLGNTPNNAQNIERTVADGGDVYTIDVADNEPLVTGEANGAPVNGTREASADQKLTVGALNLPKNVALAKLNKVRDTNAYQNNGTAEILGDDTVAYNLSLTVQSTDTTGNGLTPQALRGTVIKVNGALERRILVSDAIPDHTKITTFPTNVPNNWEVVYTQDNPSIDANAATWTRLTNQAALDAIDQSVPANRITRIGFIDTNATQQAEILPGQTVSGFSYTADVDDDYGQATFNYGTGLVANSSGTGALNSLQIANIAQVFGTSKNDPFSRLIMDESGDAEPANYSANGSHPWDTDGNGTPDLGPELKDGNGNGTDGIQPTDPDNDGYYNLAIDTNNDGNFTDGTNLPTLKVSTDGADVTAQIPDGYLPDANNDGLPDGLAAAGIDSNNNNTGAGTYGEFNVITITEPAGPNALLIGPQNAPDATGPSGGTLDDFTNKAAPVATNTIYNATTDPEAVNFTNTIKNTGTNTASFTILPQALTTAEDLPDGTVVVISKGQVQARYVKQSNGTWIQDNNANNQVDGAGIDSAIPIAPIVIANLAPNATSDVGVEVNLPANTPLSTAPSTADPTSAAIGGYDVPIVAFIDAGTPDNAFTAADTIYNITIDRVYNGYVRLIKESRLEKGAGPDLFNAADATWSTLEKTGSPGNIINYRIRYENITETQTGGNGNILLNATNVVITEDGNTAANSWAKDADNDGNIDTTNVPNSATDTKGVGPNYPSIAHFNGAATASRADSVVTKYVNSIAGTLAPTNTGTFEFKRQIQSTP